MANWFKEEIDHMGERLEKAIEKASHEIADQRSLTRNDIEALIIFASDRFAQVLDEKIVKIKNETSEMIDLKVDSIRLQLSEAAQEQKKLALQKIVIALVASLLVGGISLLVRKFGLGEVDLIGYFRALLLALVAGYSCWLFIIYIYRYFSSSRENKNAILLGVSYFNILNTRGLFWHIAAIAILLIVWYSLNYAHLLSNILSYIKNISF